MAVKFTCIHMICIMLTIRGTWTQEISLSKDAADSDAYLTKLFKSIPSIENAVLQKDYVSKICPQLWDKESNFDGTAGYLGSLEEIDTFCRKNTSSICTLAVWMSSYLCNATQGLGSEQDIPKPPKVPNFLKLNSTESVCAEIGSDELKSDIGAAVASSGNAQLQTQSPFFPIVHGILIEMCPKTCLGENLRTCQVILQGLRTVVAWEELKKKLSSSSNSDASPTEPSETTSLVTSHRLNGPVNNPAIPVQPVPNSSATNGTITKETVTTKTTAATTLTSTTTTVSSADMADEEEPVPPVEDPSEAETDVEKPRLENDGDFYGDEDDAEKGMEENVEENKKPDTVRKNELPKSSTQLKDYSMDEPEDTHFIIYFLVCLGVIVTAYVVYHRRNRVMALIVEGRSGSQRRRGTSGRSRTSSASYKRLDNNLEEVVTSSRPVRSSNVIY